MREGMLRSRERAEAAMDSWWLWLLGLTVLGPYFAGPIFVRLALRTSRRAVIERLGDDQIPLVLHRALAGWWPGIVAEGFEPVGLMTWKGAALGVWGSIWPITAIRRARIDAAAQALLREMGIDRPARA